MISRRTAGWVCMLLALSACGSESSPEPRNAEAEALDALASVGTPEEGAFEGGRFEFGPPVPGPSAPAGQLASTTWDVYFVREDGQVGAWGAGMDVFDNPEVAQTSAREVAEFWACDGERSEVTTIETESFDVLYATTCRHPTKDGYYGNLAATDGRVSANLTLRAPHQQAAAAALNGVWSVFSGKARRVADLLE